MTQRILIVLMTALLALSCSELKTDLPAPVTTGVKVHEAGWAEKTAPNFHGRTLETIDWDDTACRTCHASDYSGGSSGVSCYSCHPPYPHSVQFARAGGRHTNYMRAMNYPLAQCQTCHGVTYTGGAILTVSCEGSGCHADASGNPKSPESCNTCHGNFPAPANLTGLAYLLSSAPPKSVVGDTATTIAGVGAHRAHLVSGTLGKTVKCQECHTVPAGVNDAGHLGALPAEVAFNDTLARLVTARGTITPAYNPANTRCSNTYCHGTWTIRKAAAPAGNEAIYTDSVMAGATATPSWVAGTSDAQCYSCHGLAPVRSTPAGHLDFALTACWACHGDVIDPSGVILNRSKHINGWVDLNSNWVSHKMQ